ncbi:glycosyltransferase [Arthrospira platensis]|uniref:glycosyltransferase n=1 Tax=Limnospira TaxID=2596745 RepID=UPI0002923219|nr:glycosyltransferase [Arthrospira platensis]AMW26618.1 hypothetical protein AP285_00015 [Arthrospira platensis YZ]MBD2671324.1 glycosyltransferase [Arthrospira platensis FACHB-439]MBD2712253.1 glycosyltransferase [Arthrospira platensis FACHB-835]MDT9297221.1 glycosyltransferase [Arthrospira platensis PCC 7345]MDT9312584.1 glycosyltransferase [Limnospira sp. Paracas R14]QQW29380.1 glycosyltransferase [Arthrospira sp. PCC 9108]
MKINLFSPLPPEETGIAEYTQQLLVHFYKYADIILWTDQENWSLELEEYAKVCNYNPVSFPTTELESGDINIYNLGNNAKFHGSIWKVSQKYPGIVILHDVNLHYLFTTVFPEYLKEGSDQEAYVNIMVKHHGIVCLQDVQKLFRGDLSWAIISERYPLTFAALDNALGVVVHNTEAFALLEQEKGLPVTYLPLSYPSNSVLPYKKKSLPKTPPYRLIIFGHLGGMYRRVQSVIKALGTFPEKLLFRLDVYGRVWDTNYLNDLIQHFELQELVKLHGWVNELELEYALANADLAINLRYPTGGEASASQLRIWSHGLPSLVTRIGWYAQIPENAVAFIRHDCEIEDIQQQLKNFIDDPERFAKIGENGREILAKEHSPALYAQKVVDFAKDIKLSQGSPRVTPQPKVSVVIYAYNSSLNIPQTIESVLQQSYHDHEIIVVDDGSTDNIREVLAPYHSQIRYTRYQNRQGISVARNQGINMARGWFIVFLDGGDRLFPNQLASQVACFESNPSIGWICGGFRWVNQAGEMLVNVEPWDEFPLLNWKTLLMSKQLFMGAMMFERQWLNWAGGFKTDLKYTEDFDLLCRLTLMNCLADWSRQVGVYRCQSPDDVSENVLEMAQAWEEALGNLFRNSQLPESVTREKERWLYHNLVWLAWNFYRVGKYELMIEYLQKSFSYTDSYFGKNISDLVDAFKVYSRNSYCNFEAYNFSILSNLSYFANMT